MVGLGIGVLVGHTTSTITTRVNAPAAAELGHLGVVSKPTDGNVVVDGRFVGVSPIDRLDLEPGKHSIVIDAFGYQPYSGTLEIEKLGKLNLSVTLAPVGIEGTTTGTVAGGGGKAKPAIVPPSALLPAGGGAAAPGAPAPKPQHTSSPAPRPQPSRPRRDCDGEKRDCNNSCSHAETDCEFSCFGCSSCNSSVGWDECKRQCDSCRVGCKQNVKFCENSCDSQYGSCQASQP